MIDHLRHCTRTIKPLALVVTLTYFAPIDAWAQNNNDRLSTTVGIDATHAYLFRGISQETSGSIAQPFAELGINLNNGVETLPIVDVILGQWNSLHSGPTGSGRISDPGSTNTTAMWYESDFYGGISLGFEKWQAGLTYTSYLSPNNSFGTVKELALNLELDDAAFWQDHLFGDISLSPHIVLAFELSGQADGGASEGTYFEFGIEPGLPLDTGEITFSFPISLGLSLNDYYENGTDMDDTFGFFEVGILATLPLGTADGYGDWELSGGLKLVNLGTYLEQLNHSDGSQLIGTGGFSIGF